GFLINIKYGVMTQDENDYGISFGGRISLPLKAADHSKGENHYDYKGSLTADVQDVLYGSDGAEIGFRGINTTLSVDLPEDILGKLVGNKKGAKAEITINTIDHMYKVNFGVELAILEVEGTIALKQVEVNSVDVIIPDELSFFLASKTAKAPIVAPFVFMTGLGGGVSNLADTIAGNTISELPPITIHLKTRLLINAVVVGDFKLSVSAQGLTFEGEGKLKSDDS